MGRVWVAWWMFPLPNQMGMWPNFRSPLLWDVFAVSVYVTVSVLFWYVGLIPDLATMRDRAKTRTRQFAYGIFALGWRGSKRQWQHYEKRLSDSRRPFDAAGPFGALDRVDGFRGLHPARLAYDDLPALLRRRVRSSPGSPWC